MSSEISCPGKRHRYLAFFAYLNGTDGVVLRARDEYLEDFLHDGVWIGKQEYRFLSHGPFPTSPHELARRINDPPQLHNFQRIVIYSCICLKITISVQSFLRSM